MSKNSNRAGISRLATEQVNPASSGLDQKSALEIAAIINSEDAKVAGVVKKALPQIARVIDVVAETLRNGGRLIYVGTGTSGRIAALDAAECPPTFNTNPKMVQFIIAGGPKALGSAVESNEDSARLGELAMAAKKPGKKDVVVGIAASGRTPFTIAAVRLARKKGAQTVALVCNANSELEKAAAITIAVPTGPEVLTGSTRMKAGTAQKMVLNMLSTGAMTRLGYVYGNLMVNVRPGNKKLRERAATILERAAGVSADQARRALRESNNDVPAALVMLHTKVSVREAQKALRTTHGRAGDAITAARRRL